MVVTEVKRALLRQVQPSGILFVQNIHDLADLLIKINLLIDSQLTQMFLTELVKNREDSRGDRRSGVEVFILDSSVDARICRLLYGFIHREQPSERIRDIGAGFIQAHS